MNRILGAVLRHQSGHRCQAAIQWLAAERRGSATEETVSDEIRIASAGDEGAIFGRAAAPGVVLVYLG